MSVRILCGHVLDKLATLPDESVHCIWTSVPYWGLRCYGTEPQIWGGDPACGHDWQDASWRNNRWGAHDDDKPGDKQKTNSGSLGFRGEIHRADTCSRCGAWRGEHGLEPTLQMWLDHEVVIWRELRRVLRKDGTAWLNCGACWATAPNGRSAANTKAAGNDDRSFRDKPFSTVSRGYGDAQHGGVYGISDIAQSGFRQSDLPSRNLCDGCREILTPHHTARNDHSRVRAPSLLSSLSSPAHMESGGDHAPTSDCRHQSDRSADAILCPQLTQALADEQVLDARAYKQQQSSRRPPVSCCRCDNCGACLLVLRSSGRDAQACECKKVDLRAPPTAARAIENQGYDSFGTASTAGAWDRRNQGKSLSLSLFLESIAAREYKSKDRINLPALLAEALHADGWYVRDEVVWLKKNPMPSSVADRTTPAHEMLYLLTRSARYFYDAEAIKEPASASTHARLSQKTIEQQRGGPKQDAYDRAGLNDGSRRPAEIVKSLSRKMAVSGSGIKNNDSMDAALAIMPADRNKRSVWSITTEPFSEAHFATAPTALVEPCILAGTSEYGACNAPVKKLRLRSDLSSEQWERVRLFLDRKGP